jgi:leucyl-tRNA synthetase
MIDHIKHMKTYDFKSIEKKWQHKWEKEKTYKAEQKFEGKKFYGLIEFPYPSGAGLHVGHPRSFTAMDIITRKKRMEGYNTLYPMGFDSFGLPTENYAIKTGRSPVDVTEENVANFTRQLKSLGFGYDWDRMFCTSDPHYYKWTQWIFLQFFKHGLAYQAETTVWWCEELGTVLANEEVIDGKSERGNYDCIRKPLSQWMLAITKYAQSLLDGLHEVDYIPPVRAQQENWIGRSEGAYIDFYINNDKVTVFTTRPETVFGVTHIVLAPEHPLVDSLIAQCENKEALNEYRESISSKTDLERTDLATEKSGVMFINISATHPVTGEEIPVYISDYVLPHYGTGAVMAVPAHDQRDYEFAKKFNLKLK